MQCVLSSPPLFLLEDFLLYSIQKASSRAKLAAGKNLQGLVAGGIQHLSVVKADRDVALTFTAVFPQKLGQVRGG